MLNLHTADLMVDERMRDRDRDVEEKRLLALAREPRDPERTPGMRDRLRRAAGGLRILHRHTAV